MKLRYGRTFFVGLAFMSICAFWQLYDNIIPLILKNTFGFGDTLTGTIMALDNVLALFLLPFFGALSDRVNSKYGKRTPFIVIGTAMAVVFSIMLPIADLAGNLVLFIVMLGLLLIALGTYRSPAVALMPDITPKPLRSKANAIINLMGTLGAVFALIMIKFLISKETKPSYLPVFIAISIFMVVCVVVLLLTIREKKLAEQNKDESEEKEVDSVNNKGAKLAPDVKKSLIFLLVSVFLWFTAYNAVTTAFSRYAFEVWNLKGGDFADCLMVATVAAAISYIPIGFLSQKLGRKKVIISGIVLMILSFSSGAFFVQYSNLLNVVFCINRFWWGAVNVN